MAAKSAVKAKSTTTENVTQQQSADTTTATASPAPGTAVAAPPGQQEQPAEGAQPNDATAVVATPAPSPAVAEQAAELAQALPANAAGQLVVAADHVATVEPVEGGELVGTSANVAVVDEFEEVGEPWAGLQRAASDVILERLRQVHGEGFTLERDDGYENGQLPRAAACYLVGSAGLPSRLRTLHWPFAPEWLKPGGRRADLVKAAALILAEIERLDRAEAAA